MSRILAFGRYGQVATELRQFPGVVALDRRSADLSDPGSCVDAIRFYQPTAVINAAAFTAVDAAEKEEAHATIINGEAPGAMAGACAALDIPLVQISTDYVFAGTGVAPWSRHDLPKPINAYGRSKCAGEAAIRAAQATHAILRTSWVFSEHGSNFVKTMLRIAENRNELSVVDDQIGGPTPAREIAMACLLIAQQLCKDPSKTGTYHFSGRPDVSWCGFARAIFAKAGRKVSVAPIGTHDFPTPAVRPLNSRLNCDETQKIFGIMRPDWCTGLVETLTELGLKQ